MKDRLKKSLALFIWSLLTRDLRARLLKADRISVEIHKIRSKSSTFSQVQTDSRHKWNERLINLSYKFNTLKPFSRKGFN